MRESFIRTSPGVWSLGSFMLCEEYDSEDSPQDALATWEDDGKKYFLHRRQKPIADRVPPEGDSEYSRFYNGSERISHWVLSTDVFIKAKACIPGKTLEQDVLTWVSSTEYTA